MLLPPNPFSCGTVGGYWRIPWRARGGAVALILSLVVLLLSGTLGSRSGLSRPAFPQVLGAPHSPGGARSPPEPRSVAEFNVTFTPSPSSPVGAFEVAALAPIVAGILVASVVAGLAVWAWGGKERTAK